MAFNFGEVLTRAWQITWRYKILWLFGILAGCSRGGGGSSSGGGNGGDGGTDNPMFQNFQQYMDRVSQWLTENWWVFILLAVVAVLIMLVAIFLGTIGRIGLIRGTLQAEEGAQTLSAGPLFNESLPYFWRVFGLSLAFGLVFFILFFTLAAAGILTAGIGFLCLWPILCLLVPAAIAAGLILEQANVAIVKENLGIMDGWRRAWSLVRANIGPVVVMALILFVLEFVVGLIIVVPIIAIVLPAAIAFAAGNGQNMTPFMFAGLCFVVYLPLLILLRGVLSTFVGSAWTLTYLRLSAPPADIKPTIIEANA